jgi:hypothetical protein
VTSAPPNARASVSAYHKAEACGATLALLRRRRHAGRALGVPVLAGADGAWLGVGAGLARVENISSLVEEAGRRGHGLHELLADGARVRLGVASCARSTIISSSGPTPAATPPSSTGMDSGVASGAACRMRAISCASSATRLLCSGDQSRVGVDQGGQRTFPWSRNPYACVGVTRGGRPEKRDRQQPLEVGRHECGSGRRRAVEGKEEVPRTEYDETERKENGGKLSPVMRQDAPPY